VSFRHDYVALGDTTGPSGRIGLRTKRTIGTAGGQVWRRISAPISGGIGGLMPTPSMGTDIVPLVSQTTMLELGGGLTGRINANVSVFANVDYELRFGGRETKRRSGAFGARYTW
jgi:hypothetical protein